MYVSLLLRKTRETKQEIPRQSMQIFAANTTQSYEIHLRLHMYVILYPARMNDAHFIYCTYHRKKQKQP